MTTNSKKYTISNEIVPITSLLFSHFIIRFQLYLILHIYILILIYELDVFRKNKFQYPNIHQFYMLYYTGSHMYQDFTYNPFHKNPNHLILYTHIYIDNDSIFVLNYIHFHSVHTCAHTVHVELKILFYLLILN